MLSVTISARVAESKDTNGLSKKLGFPSLIYPLKPPPDSNHNLLNAPKK